MLLQHIYNFLLILNKFLIFKNISYVKHIYSTAITTSLAQEYH